MRVKFAIGITIVAAVVLGADLLGVGSALEYRRAFALSEPWRLFTGHFVHITFLHALLNAVALVLLGRLFADRLRHGEMFAILGVAPVLISVLFWALLPELEWYRGLSGVLHAVYFAGCVVWLATTDGRARWLPIAALLVGTLKVLLEQPWDASFPMHEWLRVAVVPQAHLVGAIVGTAAGLVLRRRRPKQARDQGNYAAS
jgi:rhomboid family GlyGly-CTERM serine protease